MNIKKNRRIAEGKKPNSLDIYLATQKQNPSSSLEANHPEEQLIIPEPLTVTDTDLDASQPRKRRRKQGVYPAEVVGRYANLPLDLQRRVNEYIKPGRSPMTVKQSIDIALQSRPDLQDHLRYKKLTTRRITYRHHQRENSVTAQHYSYRKRYEDGALDGSGYRQNKDGNGYVGYKDSNGNVIVKRRFNGPIREG